MSGGPDNRSIEERVAFELELFAGTAKRPDMSEADIKARALVVAAQIKDMFEKDK